MDPISDFLNKLKMASRTGKESFVFPASKVVANVALALEKKGYISKSMRKGKRGRFLEVKLAFEDGAPKVKGVKRVSHLSKRIYLKNKELRPVRSGFGAWILSTPKGILSDSEAKTEKVGGEVLFEIW